MKVIRLNTLSVCILSLAILNTTMVVGQDEVEIISNSVEMKLARIPAGTFMMGSPRKEIERDRTEVLHEVTISKPFFIGVYEVTQAEYTRVMKDTPDFRNRAVFTRDRGGGLEHPMENVEWSKAVVFCKQLSARPAEKKAGRSYRLPSEAEWEYACRAGTTTAFHFTDALSSQQANFNGKFPYGGAEKGPYLRKTAKVGSFEKNAFGLYDMHGNVAEWCADFYDPEYFDNSPDKDPLGPPLGVIPTNFGEHFRVVRGGCWLDDGRACRSAFRYRAMPTTQYRLIGFRVVCENAEDAGGQ